MQAARTNWPRALVIPLTILAWLAVLLVSGWVLEHVVKTILTIVLSGIVAFALTPLVGLLDRRMPRGLAIAIAYVLGFGLVLALGAILVITAAAQVTTLVNALPHYSELIRLHEPQIVKFLRPFGVTHAKFVHTQGQLTAYLQTIGTGIAKSSLDIITGVVGAIIDVILVLILSVYLAANGPRIARGLRREAPDGHRDRVSLFISIVNRVVGGYIRGQLVLALLIGTLVGVGMLALHVPYAVLLGVLAFFMEFIPIVGVLVSGSVCLLIAVFQGWVLALLVLAYFAFVHVIEGEIVGPRIMGKAVGIHPATALIALVAGTEIFGFWGALLGAPIAGLLQAMGMAAWAEYRGGDPRAVLNSVQDVAEASGSIAASPVAKPEPGRAG